MVIWKLLKCLLLDPRVDPSANDNHGLKFACINGHWEIVKCLLLDPRVDPSDRDNYGLKLHVQMVIGKLLNASY